MTLALIGAAVWFFAVREDAAAVPDLTQSQLEDALLTPEDLGDGYTEEPEDDEDDQLDVDDLDTSDECKDLIQRFEGDDSAETKAKREFESDSGGLSLTHEITVPGEESPEFDVLGDVVDSCGEIGFDEDDFAGTMTVAESESPSIADLAIGDRAFAMDVEFEITEPLSTTITSKVIFWERDGLISSIQANGGLDGEPDTDLLIEMAELADERLVGGLESAG